MPTFFMRTYGQSAGFGDPWTNDMDTATLAVTPELIDVCRKRSSQVLELAAQDQSLWKLHFWDEGRISWWDLYPNDLIERTGLIGAEEDADNGYLVQLPDASLLKLEECCAVECAQMRVLIDRQTDAPPICEFGWGAYRKHCDVWVTTPTFPIAAFEDALAKGGLSA